MFSGRVQLGFFGALALVALGLAELSTAVKYPVSNDGAGYIEEAENLVAGHGLVRTPRGAHNLEADHKVASGVYPPGYLAVSGRGWLRP